MNLHCICQDHATWSASSGDLQQQAGGSIDLCSPDRTLRCQSAGGLGIAALPVFGTAACECMMAQVRYIMRTH